MDIFIKETLYVLDYDNNIVDMIFTSDDHRTPGYAYNINIEESNMGYSNLTFTMPTKIMPMANDFGEVENSQELIPNPKLAKLTPLVKLRYNRQVIYTGTETIMVQTPQGYGDTTTYIDVEYKPGQVVENYVMDYIVQPLDKKRSGYEVSVTFNAIDYPRFNLSKKKFGLTINEDTITRSDWSLFDAEPMSIAGTVKYIQWNEELKAAYETEGFPIPLEWDPTTDLSYPMNATQINNMLGAKKEWPYGLTATVYWWPITNTGRFEGIMYEKGDFLTLQIYPKFETGTADTSTIETNLDFYGYEWLYLDKGKDYLTPNNPCNYLNWTLENTNWSIATKKEKPAKLHSWFSHPDKLTPDVLLNALPNPEWFDYEEGLIMRQVVVHNGGDPTFVGHYMNEELPQLAEQDLGKWAYVTKDGTYEDWEISTFAIYSWDGYKWYHNYNNKEYIDIHFYQMRNKKWVNIDKEYWVSTVDKSTGILYDIDIVETEVAKPDSSSGSLFETTDLRASLSLSDSNCYNAITEIAKTFQLYPVFDCEKRTVTLKLFAGKNYGLTYMLGRSLENTAIKADGDKVITKLYSYGGQDAKGSENINLGDAERSYEKPADNPDERIPWDPNAPEYIQKRSPYGTNYIYNFKWMFDNHWMSQDQILGLYDLNSQIQELNKKVLKPLTEDFVATTDAYINAGVQLSTDQDEYLAVINSMMNTYYRRPGETTEKFTAFPVAPAGCYEKITGSNIYYLDLYHCHTCGATRGKNTENGTCTTTGCTGVFEKETIHINTWEEEADSKVGQGTTSEQWDPSSKGFFQEVYEQLGTGLREYIYLNKIFEEENIDDLSTEKKYIINGTTVYDKSSHLYHWNDCVTKWIKQYGLTIEDEKRVVELQHRVNLLEEAQKVYQHDLAILEDKVQDEYGNFIIEGKFNDPEIVYPAVLLVKTLEASDQYAIPEITYSLNVIDSSGLIEYRMPGSEVYNELVHSLHSVGQIVPKAGDYVTIYDEPMGLYGVPGLITNIKRVLDNPQSNSITVDTSYTDNEELVGNIITATNTVLSNKDIYARTVILKSDGTISGAAMAKTLEESVGENISFIGVSGSTLLDSTGLLATNPNNPERKMKYTGAGIFGTVDNGVTYDAMMTPEGINANYINSGSIDTRRLQIISGLYSKVVLDNFGLSVKADASSRYTLPTQTKTIEGEKFLDWKDSNVKAFIGVDAKNNAQLYLNGQMQIEGGSIIGGWNVLGQKLFSNNGTSAVTGELQNYVGLSSTGEYALWTGHQDPEKANFRIKHNGEIISETLNGEVQVLNNRITTEIHGPNNDDKGGVMSKFTQLADSISLSVSNEYSEAGITISIKDPITGETSTGKGTIKMTGLVSFIDLSSEGSTTIHGGNITTGKIKAKYIDATDLHVSSANIDGTLSADKISGGTISASTINLKNGTFKVTTEGYVTASSGKIGGWELSSSQLSATNAGGSCSLDPSTGLLSFCTNTANPESFTFNGGLSAYTLGIDLSAKTSVGIYAGFGSNANTGNVTISSTKGSTYYVKMNHLYASSDISASAQSDKKYWLAFNDVPKNSPARIRSNGSNLCLYAASGSSVYAGGDTADYKIKTAGATPSSLNVKTNLVSLKDEYDVLYEEMKEVQAYNFDYKYGNVNGDLTSDYGFIIDEIENTQHLSHYFKNHEAVRVIDEHNALQHVNSDDSSQEGMEHIDIKVWDTDSYIKGLFVMIKTLQHKIDKLEEELKKEKTY